MPQYISFQYSNLVIAAQISITEIEVKEGEPRRWKMLDSDHERIMNTCIPITLWPYE